jgi:hypothetical protein
MHFKIRLAVGFLEGRALLAQLATATRELENVGVNDRVSSKIRLTGSRQAQGLHRPNWTGDGASGTQPRCPLLKFLAVRRGFHVGLEDLPKQPLYMLR